MISRSVGIHQGDSHRMKDWLMLLADLVAHILDDTFQWSRSLVFSIWRSFGDLQVEEVEWRPSLEWLWCLWGGLADDHGVRQEKADDDYPMVPVRAHGGRMECRGRWSGPSKSCDDVITRVTHGELRNLFLAEVSPHAHPCDPSPDRSWMGQS